jgi:beta-lactamase regulating signal transducer with metallopeptidase domain
VSPLELALANVAAWSVQIGVLALVAAALARFLPIERPGARLVLGETLLALMLALPLVQPWRITPVAVSWSLSPAPAVVPIAATQAAAGPLAGAPRWSLAVALVLLLGAALQLLRLTAALVELRALGRRARALEPPPWLRALRDEVAPRARFAVSDRTQTPSTFGLRRPLILLPSGFESAARERQAQIALHELLHVRHGDWLAVLLEELLEAVFFFHPAVHWLVARVRVAREQCVDAGVVRRLGGREAYLESLLEAARASALARAVPAAPFFRESHLRERVDLLLKEVSMSGFHALRNAGLTLFALLATLALSASAVPMQAPESKAPAEAAREDEVSMAAPRIVRKARPVYPPEAKAEKLEGLFVIDIVIGRDGAVQQAGVVASAPTAARLHELEAKKGTTEAIEGDPRLAAAALDAVKAWQYEPVLKDGQPVEARATVTVSFKLY